MGNPLKIGLVLGGGFARGAAQAGFLKGLEKYLGLEEISLISSSSIGGLNGIAYSKNNLEYLEYVYKNMDLKNLKNLKINLKNKLVDEIIDNICDTANSMTVPIYVSGTQILPVISTHYFYLDNNTEYDYMRRCLNITVTFPGVNGLCTTEFGRVYLDGGGTDNIPLTPFSYFDDYDLILILHCYPKYVPPQNMVYGKTLIVDVDIAARCDNSISTYSFQRENLIQMFDIGYEYGQEFGSTVLATRDMEEIRRKSREFMATERELRKNKVSPLTAALFFNRLHQSRGFK